MMRMKRIAAALLATVALAGATGGAMAQEGAKIFVVGGKADDPFFAVIKKGVDDAARAVEAYGGSVSFLQLQTYDQIGPDAANLVRTAINQGADGIAVPNWVPEAEDPAIKAARRRGHSGDDLQFRRHREGEGARRAELHRLRRVPRGQGRWRVLRRARRNEGDLRQHGSGRREPRGALQGRGRRHDRRPASLPSSCRCRRQASATRPPWPRPSRRPC